MEQHLVEVARSDGKIISLTMDHIKSATLRDVFALIHMCQLGYDIKFDFNESDYAEIEWEAEYLNFRWPHDGPDVPLMIFLVQDPNVVASYVNIFKKWGDEGVEYVCPVSDEVIEMAEETQTIHYWVTRSMMKSLGIVYPKNGSEYSKSFFDNYIGLVPTKRAEPGPELELLKLG